MRTARKTTIAPRCLSLRQAAEYMNLSPNSFRRLIKLGLAPAPLVLPGLQRTMFDRHALDRAIDARSEHAGEVA